MGLEQWEVTGKGYMSCSKTTKQLPPGVYVIASTPAGFVFVPRELKTDNLLRFEDPTHQEIIGEIDNFWSLKPKYSTMGFLHNRSLLMWGPPGSGKSCISKIVVSDVIDRDNIVINCTSLYGMAAALHELREVEPDRQMLVLMEDIDSIDGQHKLLPLLDGEDTVDNILYLCTTNYIDRLSDRIMRPGRIDRKISVPCPPRTGRVAFLSNKLGEKATEIDSLADATQGLSFAHLRELLVGIYCLGQDPEKVIKRLHNKGAEELTPREEMKMDRKIRANVRKPEKRREATASVMNMRVPAIAKAAPQEPFKITAEEKLYLLRRRNR